MRGIFTGRRGLAPVLLVVVVVWALAAVLMLTGTIVSANRIDTDVNDLIKPEVSSIATDARSIELARQTERISRRISVVAQPLTGHLTDTQRAARGIDATAKSILLRVFSINNTASAINGNARDINTTVHGINSNVQGINANAQSINANAQSINASARSINTTARAVNADVRGIRSKAGNILASVRSIDAGVGGTQGADGINDRAEAARPVIALIGGDLDRVVRQALGIDRHANEIDCSRLINQFPTPGGSTGCQR